MTGGDDDVHVHFAFAASLAAMGMGRASALDFTGNFERIAFALENAAAFVLFRFAAPAFVATAIWAMGFAAVLFVLESRWLHHFLDELFVFSLIRMHGFAALGVVRLFAMQPFDLVAIRATAALLAGQSTFRNCLVRHFLFRRRSLLSLWRLRIQRFHFAHWLWIRLDHCADRISTAIFAMTTAHGFSAMLAHASSLAHHAVLHTDRIFANAAREFMGSAPMPQTANVLDAIALFIGIFRISIDQRIRRECFSARLTGHPVSTMSRLMAFGFADDFAALFESTFADGAHASLRAGIFCFGWCPSGRINFRMRISRCEALGFRFHCFPRSLGGLRHGWLRRLIIEQASLFAAEGWVRVLRPRTNHIERMPNNRGIVSDILCFGNRSLYVATALVELLPLLD